MTAHRHTGACHCGAVKFEVTTTLLPATRCDCSPVPRHYFRKHCGIYPSIRPAPIRPCGASTWDAWTAWMCTACPSRWPTARPCPSSGSHESVQAWERRRRGF